MTSYDASSYDSFFSPQSLCAATEAAFIFENPHQMRRAFILSEMTRADKNSRSPVINNQRAESSACLQVSPAPPYLSMLCSFSSSFLCLSITDRMMLRSSSVRWLRSGSSGPDPAPRGGPDILTERDGRSVGQSTCLTPPPPPPTHQ